jgi:hypothetical protein
MTYHFIMRRYGPISSHSILLRRALYEPILLKRLILFNMFRKLTERICINRTFSSVHQVCKRHHCNLSVCARKTPTNLDQKVERLSQAEIGRTREINRTAAAIGGLSNQVKSKMTRVPWIHQDLRSIYSYLRTVVKEESA